MDKLMNAIILADKAVTLQQVSKPQAAEPQHLLIKMIACALNPGDITFITRPLPPGAIAGMYGVYGVSGVGTVVDTGAGVPAAYAGKNVLIYRSLQSTPQTLGTWSEYTHMHFLSCVILPDDVDAVDYAGSLVNIITPFAFVKQILDEGYKGIISTAGTSATGIAMVGVCKAYNVPLVSIVRTQKAKKELEVLGAENIVVEADADFQQNLKEAAEKLSATAVFDGVGGLVLNKIMDVIPNGSTIYCYGYLGGAEPLSIHTGSLMRGITIKGFGNFRTATVQNPQQLEQALKDIAGMIRQPHFKTKTGKKFKLTEVNEAVLYSGEDGKKAVLEF